MEMENNTENLENQPQFEGSGENQDPVNKIEEDEGFVVEENEEETEVNLEAVTEESDLVVGGTVSELDKEVDEENTSADNVPDEGKVLDSKSEAEEIELVPGVDTNNEIAADLDNGPDKEDNGITEIKLDDTAVLLAGNEQQIPDFTDNLDKHVIEENPSVLLVDTAEDVRKEVPDVEQEENTDAEKDDSEAIEVQNGLPDESNNIEKMTDLDKAVDNEKENITEIPPQPELDTEPTELKMEKDMNDNDNEIRTADKYETANLNTQEKPSLKAKPKAVSVKNSIAKFNTGAKKDKGMFITVQPDKCSACEKTVYAMEKLEMNKNIYHRGCFKCSHCSATLTAKTFSINEGVIYCTTHFKQLFARKGNYDEGFGRQQYKKRWVEEQAAKKDATA